MQKISTQLTTGHTFINRGWRFDDMEILPFRHEVTNSVHSVVILSKQDVTQAN